MLEFLDLTLITDLLRTSLRLMVPIAFAVGLVPLSDEGGGGTADRLMGMVTGLATQAGWLYGGTLVASLLVLGRRVRRVREINRRAARSRPRP